MAEFPWLNRRWLDVRDLIVWFLLLSPFGSVSGGYCDGPPIIIIIIIIIIMSV